jgi:hypothetical protein
MTLDAKQKKYLIIGGTLVIVIYIISKWLRTLPKPEDKIQATPELNKDLVLSKGSKGAEVSELQRALLKDYSANLGDTGVNKDGIDGDFGILTEVALKKAKGVTEIALKDL